MVSLWRADWRLQVPLTLCFGALVASVGTVGLPLDGHEVFVVESAQEMHQRGDWIVPHFNGEPRLNKPPLNYWLTAMVAAADGSLDSIRPWHGRVPSIAAGLGLIALTLFIGRKLYDKTTGLLGGLMLAASVGFFTYTHDARPDMLYAFFCTAGYASLIAGWRADERGRALAAYGMWVSYALATLTEGPHLPAMLLVACFMGLAPSLTWRQFRDLFRPVGGLVVFALIAAPWWLLLDQRLGAGGLQGTQLSGSLLTINWDHLLDPYYFYRPLQLLLPCAALFPTAILAFRHGGRWRKEGLLLISLYLVPALLLGFGPQQRWFYMLPALVPACLVIAAGTTQLIARIGRERAPRWSRWFFNIHGMLILAVLAGMTVMRPPGENISPLLVTLLAVTAITVSTLFFSRKGHIGQPLSHIAAFAISFGITLAGLGTTKLIWSRDRFERVQLAAVARQSIPADTPLGSWGVNPNVFVYYTQRRIRWLHSAAEVETALAASPNGKLALFIENGNMHSLPPGASAEILSAGTEQGEDSRSLS